MDNIYGDNVSWFYLEGSVTLEESKVAGDFLLDDEFEVYGEDSSGNEGSVNVDVIKLLESAHVCIGDKDKKIDRMVEEIAELKGDSLELIKAIKFLYKNTKHINELQSKNIESMIEYHEAKLNQEGVVTETPEEKEVLDRIQKQAEFNNAGEG
ncbi:hypothetical protein NVP1275O_46 [Vibrio phage 1.275.O._10N.286.54.E11]|nr:hypothetical protein NVP1275O_46 [Vibrio phage 1.275.O._10N.286.54.E11]